MKEEKNSGGLILGFILGATLGGVLGVLYAPNEGKKTRKILSYRLAKTKVRLREIIDNLVEGKETYTTLAKSKGERVIKDARSKAEKLLSDVEDLMTQIKNK